MKNFSIIAAIGGAPIETKNGLPAQLDYIIGSVNGKPVYWNFNGEPRSLRDEEYELVMAPVQKQEWVVRYKQKSDKICVAGPFDNEKEAHAFLLNICIPGKIIPLTFSDQNHPTFNCIHTKAITAAGMSYCPDCGATDW